jgi:hypothetical protein
VLRAVRRKGSDQPLARAQVENKADVAGPVPPKRLMPLIGRGWPEPGAA